MSPEIFCEYEWLKSEYTIFNFMQKLQLVPLSRPTACARHRSEICHQITQATLVCYLLVNNISIQSWQITENWVPFFIYAEFSLVVTLANGKLLRAFVFRVTKLPFVSFQLRLLESTSSVRPSALFFCTYENTRTLFKGVLWNLILIVNQKQNNNPTNATLFFHIRT